MNKVNAQKCPMNEREWERFLDGYYHVFCGIAGNIILDVGTREDVEDCLSEAFAYIWFNKEKYSVFKQGFWRWCVLVVRSRAKNKRKYVVAYEEKKKYIREVMEKESVSDVTPETIFLEKADLSELCGYIGRLPYDSGKLFVLKYFYGLTYGQMSEHCGLSAKQVDNHLSYAKKRLKKFLLEDGDWERGHK